MIEFNNILIVLLLGIIVLLFIKSERKCVCEDFSTLDDEMNMNESQKVMNACNFSLECCPSMYSNDKGCMCMDKKQKDVLQTRGYNRTNVDGFGY